MEGELWKAVLRLIIFLPLVLLLAYWSIKIGASRGTLALGMRNMRLAERIALGPKTGLCIVKISDKYYLIGFSEQRVELLKELSDYEETNLVEAGAQEWQKLRGPWNNWIGPRTKE